MVFFLKQNQIKLDQPRLVKIDHTCIASAERERRFPACDSVEGEGTFQLCDGVQAEGSRF